MRWWREAPVEARLFAFIAAYLVVAGGVYIVTSDESAGGTLLLSSAAFGFGYAAWSARHLADAREMTVAAEEGEGEPLYLPHESAWPLGLGAGSALIVAGLAIGTWLVLPGALLAGRSVVGLASESRLRT